MTILLKYTQFIINRKLRADVYVTCLYPDGMGREFWKYRSVENVNERAYVMDALTRRERETKEEKKLSSATMFTRPILNVPRPVHDFLRIHSRFVRSGVLK